jgi:hypothetical protein
MLVEKQTVFILGAGTSIPYGFPSGLGLLREIQDAVGQPGLFKVLKEAGMDVAAINEFGGAVRQCGRSSIDAFLEARSDLVEVGKAAIAACLIPREQPSELFRADPGIDFYRYLFTRLSDGIDAERFRQHRLSIVTYNYDRSLEDYLQKSIKNSYGMSDEDAAALLLATIPIIHVHGQLAKLDWQVPLASGPAEASVRDWNIRSYFNRTTEFDLRRCLPHMQIISDGNVEGGEEYRRAREKIVAAEVLCFLGFGYHRVNIQRLFSHGRPHNASYFGTTLGLSPVEIREAVTLVGASIHVPNPDFDSVQALRHVGPLI